LVASTYPSADVRATTIGAANAVHPHASTTQNARWVANCFSSNLVTHADVQPDWIPQRDMANRHQVTETWISKQRIAGMIPGTVARRGLRNYVYYTAHQAAIITRVWRIRGFQFQLCADCPHDDVDPSEIPANLLTPDVELMAIPGKRMFPEPIEDDMQYHQPIILGGTESLSWGTLLLVEFARMHGMSSQSLTAQARNGIIPHTAIPRPERPGQWLRYFSPEQQTVVIRFWRRIAAPYVRCAQCSHGADPEVAFES